MRRLVLVRHGESVWNAEARVQGQRCAGLSALGHAQARVTAAALAVTHPGARLVSSDLPRAVETAAPLAAELRTEVRGDQRLRERTFGAWEARLRDEVEAADPQRWSRWLAGEDVIAEVGGESGVELGARAAPVFAELLASTAPGEVTVAVTHGGTIWHGLHRLLGLSSPTLGAVANASVTELVARGEVGAEHGASDQLLLDRWNEVAHLPVELRTAWRPRAVSSDGLSAGR